MVKKNQRTNNVSLKLTDNEKERITLFANQRDLSIAEYLRMSALKHKIKPTVIEINRDKTKETQDKHLNKFLEIMNELSPKVADNGYVYYKDGGKQILELVKLYNSMQQQDL